MIPEHLKTILEQHVADAVSNRETAVEVMKELQRHYGWLTDEALAEASQLLGLSLLQVEELATFYEMIYRRPVGRHVVHVCDSISCWASGGETLLESLSNLLEIKPGSTTSDGAITLLPCSCLGNCGEAPCMMVGEVQYGRMTPETGAEMMAALRDTTPAG
ncbi:MAG: NADH-quinone oxidoreductase subunit NuoE [Desulfuromonadaceae bacterium]